MLHAKQTPTWRSKTYQTSGPIQLAGRVPELYLSCLGRFVSTGRFVYQQVSPGFALHVIEAGRGVMAMDGKNFDVGPGDLFTFFPGHHYHYHDAPATPWRYTWISLDGSQAAALLKEVGITPDSPRMRGNFAGVLNGLFKEIAAVYQQPTIAPTFAITAAWRLIDALADTNPSSSQPRSVAEAARFLIDHQTLESLSVEALAGALGVSRSALFRQFREAFGVSPKEYQDSVRMSRAQSLLRQSPSSLKQIAAACGYASCQYFIRAFTKHTGSSPGQWRKRKATR